LCYNTIKFRKIGEKAWLLSNKNHIEFYLGRFDIWIFLNRVCYKNFKKEILSVIRANNQKKF